MDKEKSQAQGKKLDQPVQPKNIGKNQSMGPVRLSDGERSDLLPKLGAGQPELEQQSEKTELFWVETLNEVLLTLSTRVSADNILNKILGHIQQMVPCAANVVLLQGDDLHIAGWRGYETYGCEDFFTNMIQPLARFPLDARAIQARQPIIIPDTHRELDWVKVAQTSWIRSFVAIPICLYGQVLGLLRLDSDIPDKFSAQDIKYLQAFASAAAIGLKDTRLSEQPQRELIRRLAKAETEIIQLNRQLLTLQYANSTIASDLDLQYMLDTAAKEMTNLLKVEGCAIFEWHQKSNKVSAMARYGLSECWQSEALAETYSLASYHLTHRVLGERRPQQITHCPPHIHTAESASMQRAKLKTLLMVPMEFQDHVVGLVKIMDTRSERIFTNMEIGLAQLLANQLASAIENTRLYERLHRLLAERMEIEKDLRQLATKQQAILNAIPDSMFFLNRNGRLLDYKTVGNHGALGILNAEIIGEDLNGNQRTNLIDLIRHYINQQSNPDEIHSFEYQVLLPEGGEDFRIRLMASGHDQVLAIVRNITERKQMESALRKERTLLRTLIDNLPDHIFVKDTEGRYLLSNKAHAQILGLTSSDEIVGKTSADFFPSDVASQQDTEDQAVIKSGQPLINKESAIVDQAGHQCRRITTKVPLQDVQGRVIGLVCIGRDISEEKQATGLGKPRDKRKGEFKKNKPKA